MEYEIGVFGSFIIVSAIAILFGWLLFKFIGWVIKKLTDIE